MTKKVMKRFICAVVAAFALVIPAEAALVPFTAGSSHNLPRVNAAEILPAKFDLRTENRIAPIREQNPWETCWAFAAIAAAESNYITSSHVSPADVDFSEMFLIWFARLNPNKSENFMTYTNGRLKLIHMGDYGAALEDGAYPAAAIACLASLEGPADESDFPYLSKARITQAGFYVNNPPTHEEAERAGLIPLRSSTAKELKFYGGRTVTPRSNLMLDSALFAASRVSPSSFANQREEYAYQNRVDRDALKSFIMNYGAAMIGYYSAEKVGKNLNAEHNAYFDNSSWLANHEITVIGWDDNFSRENFITKPSIDGAWLARNNWGNFAGSDGGYEWISYEQLIGDGVVCIMKDRPANLKIYEHDQLGWCNSYTYREKQIWGANVFFASTSGETLQSVSFYTPYSNMQTDIYIYDLSADFDGKSPVAGTLKTSKSAVFPYAGYHTIALDSLSLVRGNYFSVVIKYTNLNGGENDIASVPIEVAVKGCSNNAAVFDNESYFSDTGNLDQWLDGTEMTDDFHGGIPYHVNACIKAFTIAPNSDTAKAPRPKTIIGVMPTIFKRDVIELNEAGSAPVSRVTIASAGVSPDSTVYFFLADKARTYEPVSISRDEHLDSSHAKGRSGPSEWALVPVYEAGFEPEEFVTEDGINYPLYGVFEVSSDASGRIEIDVDNLRLEGGIKGKIPKDYYTVYCMPDSGIVSEIGVFFLSATSSGQDTPVTPEPSDTPSDTPSEPEKDTQSGSSSGGGGGGCDAGIFCGVILLSVLLLRKR